MSTLLAFFVILVCHCNGLLKEEAEKVNVWGAPASFDCPMRELALQYAQRIQPWLSSDQLQEIADALNGTPEAMNCNISLDLLSMKPPKQHREAPKWTDINYNDYGTIFIDSVNGNDYTNDGTIIYPFQSISRGIKYIRLKYKKTDNKKIILRKGRYYLKNTLYFNENDSNLLITNYNGEKAEISGAVPLNNLQWTLYKNGENNKNIYKTTISSSVNITDIPGLRINGIRAIRCRYPNANPETDGFGSTLKAKSWVAPISKNPLPEIEYYPDEPYRNDSAGSQPYFQHYSLGIGGTACDNFTPRAGYWCSTKNQGGGPAVYRVPTGLVYDKTILPHAPYANTSGGVIQTWRPGHWSSWMFEIGDYDSQTETMLFSKGGFQGARGNNNGDEFYVENVMEELDMPTEWFFNTTTRVLYYYSNETNKDPSNVQFEATKLQVLMNFTGNMTNPVKNVAFKGVTIRDTAITYLEPHGMPSGGDWGLQRTGAFFLDGCENFTFSENLFTRMDGIAISINGYNRNHTIYKNEAIWNGESFVTLWGDTEGISFPDSDTMTTMGWDGTTGTQPRFINMSSNYIHELGIWEKQSSMYFQAKSCQNYLYGNIFYNGPRAGINFNDGFGGGSTLLSNLLFNTCRESGDHGPFNSWDRQVYVTSVVSGTPSYIKLYDEIAHNFMIGNYHTTQNIDNDDGSNYYSTHHNFLPYGCRGLKTNFGGHDNHHFDNIYGYVCNYCMLINSNTITLSGHIDKYYNNTCIYAALEPELQNGILNWGTWNCDPSKYPKDTWPQMGNNVIYTSNNSFTHPLGLCGKNESYFQSTENWDMGTTINGAPNNTQIIEQAHGLLWI